MGSVGAETSPRPAPGPDSRQPAGAARRPLATIGGVAALVVVLDQLTKWWALEALTDPTRAIDLVWTLRLRVIENTGTAFSLTSDSGPWVTIIALAVVAYLVVSGRNQRSRWVLASFGLVVGGTVGNLLDRLLREGDDGFLSGPVIDFVDLQWFPVFNLADAALTVGIGLLLVVGFFTDALDDEPPAERS
ncbi:MAG TPA: signal peptidase II [Acidimicrobiales bacterium]|nr:signal peptidase II [Acidimicrobiales bacterium]